MSSGNIFVAEIAEIFEDGVSLVLDGEETEKHYKVDGSIPLDAGQRVIVCEVSGTYVVLSAFSEPNGNSIIPSGGTDGQFLTKDGNDGLSLKWTTLSLSGLLPTGGSNGQVLTKDSSATLGAKWASVPGTITAYGSSGMFLHSTGSGMDWTYIPGTSQNKATNIYSTYFKFNTGSYSLPYLHVSNNSLYFYDGYSSHKIAYA